MRIKSFLIFINILPRFLFPCAVCYGNPESPMSYGMNMGILTLMGFIGFVLIIVAYSIISISIKTKNIKNLEGQI